MLIKNKIIRDTVLLTLMQIALDSAGLLLNVFITGRLGSSAMGILSLTGSFLVLAGTLSNGNAFLCTSRLVSEELGRKNNNPQRVLFYAVALCSLLSCIVSVLIIFLAPVISSKFFSTSAMCKAVRMMPFALLPGAFSACLKGYFNAFRRSEITASGDILEFIVKALTLIILTLVKNPGSESEICTVMITGIIAGNVFSLVFFALMLLKHGKHYHGKASIGFSSYVKFALPIMAGSVLTSALSSANDALIPVTLRQFGNSVEEALSKFGIFEAIVIPTLFFPSVALCSMSGIIVSETARARSAGDNGKLRHLTEKLVGGTLIYAVFASAVLIKFGAETGMLLGGGALAGKMISVIAPVIPFIYLEIILEALIKGMGLQSFSSLNYLAEYAVRISCVLVFVPVFGFYGIVISYYSSNIIGNLSRLIKILRHTKAHLSLMKAVIPPVILAFMTLKATELPFRFFSADTTSLPVMIAFVLIWTALYFAFFAFKSSSLRLSGISLGKFKSSFVESA